MIYFRAVKLGLLIGAALILLYVSLHH